jgi:signal peptide peptidase SppA
VEEAAADIRAAREVKPVISSVNVDAGSAAYWLASQASEVSITPSGMAGSIGAFMLHLDFSGMNEKQGIEPTYVSAGRFKVEGNPDEPLSDEGEAYLQGIVDETFATFVRDVAEGRGITEKSVRQGFGEGRMVTAEPALEAGMVDRIETFEEAVARALDGGASSSSGPRAQIPSERAANLQGAHEAEHDEEPTGPSHLRKSRIEDEALADQALASTTR